MRIAALLGFVLLVSVGCDHRELDAAFPPSPASLSPTAPSPTPTPTAEPTPTPTPTPLPAVPPPAPSPAVVNGASSFSLVRGAGDCGIGLRSDITGALTISDVPNSGRGGRASMDYGTVYTWLELAAVVGASRDVIDFESVTGLPATVTGFEVFLSGRMTIRDRRGFIKFIWVQIGQPRTNPCATFEGSMAPR